MKIKYVNAEPGKQTCLLANPDSGDSRSEKGNGLSPSHARHPSHRPSLPPRPREAVSLPSPPAPGLLQGPALGSFLRWPRFCAELMGLQLKPRAGRELSPGCGNRAVGPQEGLAFVCADPQATANSHGDRPGRCAEAGQPRALPRGGGVRLLKEAHAGPCPPLPRNPGGEWSELTREERIPCRAQRIMQSGDTH